MGILFAALVVACSASTPPKSPAPPAPRVKEASAAVVRESRVSTRVTEALARAERDFARRTRDLGLSGTSPLFGAEGLPRPRLR